MQIAILGLGIIGAVWARNLQADGLSVKTWNRTPKNFAGSAGFCEDPAEAARGADLVLVVVSDPAAVQAVLAKVAPVLKAGQIVAVSSTISSQWTLKFAAQVHGTGATYLEAPFTGSKIAAEERKTVFFLGGDADTIEKVRPVLSRQATHLMHVGPLGSGSAIKLAMNMNIAMVMEALSESRRFALSQGLTDDLFFEALKINVSRSGVSDLKEPKLRKGDFSPQFSLKHMHKDLGLAVGDMGDASRANGANGAGGVNGAGGIAALGLPMFAALKQRYDEGMTQGLGDSDFSVLDSLLNAG